MLKKFIHEFARPKHPWRRIKFDELAEMYTSMSLRSFGFGIIGIFVPIFLYKNGASLQSVFLFYALFFILRVPFAFISGYVVGRIGPKHSIALSTLLIVVFLSMLLTYKTVGWPLSFLAIIFTVSNGLFFIAYNTDFSKIKDSKHGGKELGWLYIFERVGATFGPLIGGILASIIAPELTIVLAISVLLGSLMPLFLSNEPVRLHQKIVYKGFPWKRHVADAVSMSSFHIENVASNVMWPLLIGVTIFTEGTYAKLGSVIAISMGISLFSAHLFGRLIDGNSGLKLLKYGVLLNFFVHLTRPFVTTSLTATALTVLSEPITLSYKMPLIKGYYDAADSEEGYRIVYLTLTEMITGFMKGLFCLSLFVLSYWFDPLDVLRSSFIVVAIISLGILVQKFPALHKA